MKTEAALQLTAPPPVEALTADSPIPFSIKRLWYELDRFEKITFDKAGNNQNNQTANEPLEDGDANQLKPAKYPPASPYNQAPYQNQRKRNIERQLDLMMSRLRDGRYTFLFDPGGGLQPDLEGAIDADLDSLVAEWVGHDKPVSVFDVSALPSEMLPTMGTMLRVIYDMLFWGQDLPIGGRQQPLLVVIDEAHLFVPEGDDTPAHRTLSTLAKEGRKYGVGLVLVSQRPSELDSTVLSQCGSLIAMRLTNASDRGRVAATVPDDLGGLVDLLPSLRTGEGIFLGEIMPIPTRVRVRKASQKPMGDDPRLRKYGKLLLDLTPNFTREPCQTGAPNQLPMSDRIRFQARRVNVMPEMHYVDSSTVEAIGYDPDTRELHVHFTRSGNYIYFEVEEWVFNEFLQAESKGQYLTNR